MNTIAWVILVINTNWGGSLSYMNDVHFASKEQCEAVLIQVRELNKESKVNRHECVAVVVTKR